MINYTDCTTCNHKEVCRYNSNLKNIYDKFKSIYEFSGFERDTVFDVEFRCKQYSKKEKYTIKGELK